ncbi:MAG TPA: GIY-YIG nuclease family protein [Gallionella sp.]|nr:GIY-YIG nuclease family protein [Gallionella sp.]
MNPGYVYVLINPSMPGLVKIGCTQRDSRARARKLYTTSVPTPFDVAFEVFSDDHEALEDQMHAQLSAFRPNGDREFFRYPLKDAINLLIQLNGTTTQAESSFSAISILNRLKEKYPLWVDPTIAEVQIVQTNERVWLEITREEEVAGYLKNQTIKRSDLAFITSGSHEESWFRPTDAVTENARKLTEEFDPYSIIMTTDLFHEAACYEVDEKLNPHRNSNP